MVGTRRMPCTSLLGACICQAVLGASIVVETGGSINIGHSAASGSGVASSLPASTSDDRGGSDDTKALLSRLVVLEQTLQNATNTVQVQAATIEAQAGTP